MRHYGETQASIRLHLETLRGAPEFFLAHYHLAFSYIDAGRLADAEFHREKAVSLSHENSLTLSLQGILQARLGKTTAVAETLEKLLRMKAEKYISSCNIASVYAASLNEDKTIAWLETALEERDPNLTWLKFDKEFRFLDRDERFQTILMKVGLTGKIEILPDKNFVKKSPRRFLIPIAIFLLAIILGLGIFYSSR